MGEKKLKKKEFKNTEETKRKTEKLKIKTKETKKFNSSTNSYIVHTRTWKIFFFSDKKTNYLGGKKAKEKHP